MTHNGYLYSLAVERWHQERIMQNNNVKSVFLLLIEDILVKIIC